VKACSREESITLQRPCLSDCYWFPEETQATSLTCFVDAYPIYANTFEEWVQEAPQQDGYHPCDCPCNALVKVEKPGMFILTISYLSQSLVVVIVGLMGISRRTFEPWSRCFSISQELKSFVQVLGKRGVLLFKMDSIPRILPRKIKRGSPSDDDEGLQNSVEDSDAGGGFLKGGILLPPAYGESESSQAEDKTPYLSTSSGDDGDSFNPSASCVDLPDSTVTNTRSWRLEIEVHDKVMVLSDEGLSVAGIVNEITNNDLQVHFDLKDVSDVWIDRNDQRLRQIGVDKQQ